jgi:hypothetical protein
MSALGRGRISGSIIATFVAHGGCHVSTWGRATVGPAEGRGERHFRVARTLKVHRGAVDILADSGTWRRARSWLLRITKRPPIGGAGRMNGAPLGDTGHLGFGGLPAGHLTGPEARKCREQLRAELRDLETISKSIVADLRTRVARNSYHPPLRAVAERLLAELTAELLS